MPHQPVIDRFRKEYGTLSDLQKEFVKRIKDKASEMEAILEEARTNDSAGEGSATIPYLDQRCLNIALTELETATMYAVKAVTTGHRAPTVN